MFLSDISGGVCEVCGCNGGGAVGVYQVGGFCFGFAEDVEAFGQGYLDFFCDGEGVLSVGMGGDM